MLYEKSIVRLKIFSQESTVGSDRLKIPQTFECLFGQKSIRFAVQRVPGSHFKWYVLRFLYENAKKFEVHYIFLKVDQLIRTLTRKQDVGLTTIFKNCCLFFWFHLYSEERTVRKLISAVTYCSTIEEFLWFYLFSLQFSNLTYLTLLCSAYWRWIQQNFSESCPQT